MLARRGFSILELLVSAFVVSLLLAAALGIFLMAGGAFRHISGHEDGTLQMRKAVSALQRDLLLTQYEETAVTDVPSSLVGADGHGIAMLSSAEDGDGTFVNQPGGGPFWQRNIVYYLVIPVGDPCSGAIDSEGFESSCPHKVMIRKVIDSGSVTTPASNPATNEESLLSDMTPYLTRPNGLDISAMFGEAGIDDGDDVRIIATNLLGFKVQRQPNADHPGEIVVYVTAFNEESSSRTTAIGSVSLENHEKKMTQVLSVFPRNKQ